MEWNVRNVLRGLLFMMLFVLSLQSQSESKKPSFEPSHYELEIITNNEHFEKDNDTGLMYDGVVNVTFKAEGLPQNKSFNITLHASSDTKIKNVTLKGDSKDVKVEKHQIVRDRLIITCPKECAGYKEFTLRLEFHNPFGNDMTGFYRSSYKEQNNTKWLLTTHFEPIFARKAFPCFDEPHLKANFTVSITVPKHIKTVLSNTPVQECKNNTNESTTYKFKKTPLPMSTYLVAFTASEFISTGKVKFQSQYSSGESGEKYLQTYGRKDVINKKEGDLAQTIGKEAVEGLTKFLGIGYAFEKIDQIGIPDFSAGAMENWGHISFREKSLFCHKTHSSAITKQSIILTITHELVHQWFGNLVTLESWDYIWLNEAFANYIEYIIANEISESKKWNLLNQMVVNEIHLRAFETDGLASSKPLNNKIESESQIFSSFNDIPYSKGAAVLRMWNFILGNHFQKCLGDYLKQRAGKTATPEQLFEACKTDRLTRENFQSWTLQAGYPVVEVKKSGESYTLTQTRFFWGKTPKNGNNTFWWVPITYTTDKSANFSFINEIYLKNEPLIIPGKYKWIIVNNEQAGYYRVNYDKENWEALTKLLSESHMKIPEINRAQIVNDVFSLARSLQKEFVQYSTALELAKYLEKEKSFAPWKSALNAFDFLQTKLYGEKFDSKYKEYVLKLIVPHFKSLSITDLDHVGTLINVEISRWACYLDYKPCVQQAEDLFNKRSFNEFPNTQEVVLCTAVRNIKGAWDVAHKMYRNTTDSDLKIMYISAMGCTVNSTEVEKLLNFTLRKIPPIPKQDLSYVLSGVYNGNLKNVEPAFAFIENNYKHIGNKYGGINPLGKALVGIARKLKTQDQLTRLRNLVKAIKNDPELSAAYESAENAIQITESNIEWVNARMNQLEKYFSSGSLLSYSLALLSACLLFVFEF